MESIFADKKKLVIAFVIIGVLIIAAVSKYAIWPATDETGKIKPGSTKLTGPEIAERIAKFLEGATKPDGSFELNYSCKKDAQTSICVGAPLEGPPHAGQIVLAFYRLYQKTGNKEYKDKADNGINYALKACREKSLDYCEWNFFPLYVYYKDTKDKKYLDAMLSVSSRLVDEEKLANIVNNNYGNKLAMLYELTGDKKYLDKLSAAAAESLLGRIKSEVFYEEGSYKVKRGDFQLVWSIYLPAYKATGNEKYLLASKNFFDNAKVFEHISAFKTPADISNLIKSMESLINLADTTSGEGNKSPYRSEAHKIGAALLNKLYDGPENKKFNGDHGFLQAPNQPAKNSKQTLTNGWLAQLYLKMSKTPFALKHSVK